jgi:hypothetical protein
MNKVTVLTIGLIVSLGVAIGTAAFAQTKIGGLQDDIRQLRAGVEAIPEPDDTISGNVAEMDARLTDLGTTIAANTKRSTKAVKLIQDCMPELQDQLYSMEVSGGYAYPGTSPSRYCSEMLNGYQETGGE